MDSGMIGFGVALGVLTLMSGYFSGSETALFSLPITPNLALSDSGGIQEEGPALNTLVLIMRNQTERPEALTAGANQLIGTDPDHIIETTQTLLNNPKAYSAMTHKGSPYGDGKAAIRIAEKTVHFLEN